MIGGSAWRTWALPIRLISVRRPGVFAGSSRSTSSAANSGVVVGPSFTPDRVGDARDEVQVRAVHLAGALAHPDEVTGQVVGDPVLDPGQRPLVVQDQRLVTGVQLDAVEGGVVHAARPHEPHRPVDLGGELLVAESRLGRARELGVPGMDAVERGQSTAGVGPQQVQRGRGGVVGAQDAIRIGRAHADELVDHVAAVGRQAGGVQVWTSAALRTARRCGPA